MAIRLLTSAIGISLAVTTAWADVVTLPTTYNNLEVEGATVMVGPATFSNFVMLTGDLTDKDVTVTALNSATQPGLEFDFNLTATANMNVAPSKSISFGYTVEIPQGTAAAFLQFAATGDTAGGAVPKDVEMLSFGGDTATLTVTLDNNDKPTMDNKLLTGLPVTVTVMETASLSTSTTGVPRTTSISSVSNTFLMAPEPAYWFETGAGLLLIGGISRKLRKRAGPPLS